MDSQFTQHLTMLKEKFSEAPPSSQSVGEHIAALNETIQSLDKMKRSFKESQDELEASTWEEQIKGIDKELAALGGQPIYNTLPDGFVDTRTFMERNAMFKKSKQENDATCLKLKQQRDRMEMEMGRQASLSRDLGPAFGAFGATAVSAPVFSGFGFAANGSNSGFHVGVPVSALGVANGLTSLDNQEEQLHYQFNREKAAWLDYLVKTKPMDSKPYLTQKHKLLDAKLELLEKLRFAEIDS